MRVAPSTAYDARELATFLRASDRAELAENARRLGTVKFPCDLVQESFRKSLSWTLWRGDDVVGMGGASESPKPGIGIIWFLGTDLADTHWRDMTRACRAVMRMEHERFPILMNVAPPGSDARLRWLSHLGFDIGKTEANGPLNGYVAFWSRRCCTAPTGD
ncbi:hypothetical protein [Rhodobacter lacus]|uniref:N-acetyltransferase domain-containing protein n=1 Tax=Rhodobacter lacus TaxID=1641972 RepID=A0ABW5ACB3_9RHOB